MEIPYIIMLNEKMQGSKLYVQDAMHYFKRLRKHTTMLILSVNGGFTKDLFSYLYYSVFFFFFFLAISPYVLIVRKKYIKFIWKFPGFPLFKVMPYVYSTFPQRTPPAGNMDGGRKQGVCPSKGMCSPLVTTQAKRTCKEHPQTSCGGHYCLPASG